MELTFLINLSYIRQLLNNTYVLVQMQASYVLALMLLLFVYCNAGNTKPATVTIQKLHTDEHHIQFWKTETSTETFVANETVLIFIDMWCWHPFPAMRNSIRKAIPRINNLVQYADSVGMKVLWAPYDKGLERTFSPYIDSSVNMNNPVFGSTFWQRLNTLNSDDGTHRGNRQLCNKHSDIPGMHPRLHIKPHHLTPLDLGWF